MTKTEFPELCKSKNISTNLIHFENSIEEKITIVSGFRRKVTL